MHMRQNNSKFFRPFFLQFVLIFAAMIPVVVEDQGTERIAQMFEEHQQLLVSSQGGAIIQPMNAFLEQFFAGQASIDAAEWERALPIDAERQQMRKLIRFLMRLPDFSAIIRLPDLLARLFPLLSKSVVLSFPDNGKFCVIHEHFPPPTPHHSSTNVRRFARFWGYAVLSARLHAARPHLHFSAPHFQSDGNVCNQSAALFERTNSRSLVIAGANRFAVKGPNSSSPCQPHNAQADAAHNDRTMFHTMCAAIWEADAPEGTLVQWHGMAPTSCKGASAFVSAGVKGTHQIYANASAPVNKLAASMNALAGREVAKTPATDAQCRLIAATNVFGRLVNGVRAERVCATGAKANSVRGHFIHVEQKRRMIANWEAWTKALEEVFPAAEEAVKNST